jgi:hypothetical protein
MELRLGRREGVEIYQTQQGLTTYLYNVYFTLQVSVINPPSRTFQPIGKLPHTVSSINSTTCVKNGTLYSTLCTYIEE